MGNQPHTYKTTKVVSPFSPIYTIVRIWLVCFSPCAHKWGNFGMDGQRGSRMTSEPASFLLWVALCFSCAPVDMASQRILASVLWSDVQLCCRLWWWQWYTVWLVKYPVFYCFLRVPSWSVPFSLCNNSCECLCLFFLYHSDWISHTITFGYTTPLWSSVSNFVHTPQSISIQSINSVVPRACSA